VAYHISCSGKTEANGSGLVLRHAGGGTGMLAGYGYETANLFKTLQAFQRHFRPARVNSRIDFETARLL
jgi:hypothetical protein